MTLRQLLQDFVFNKDTAIKRNAIGLLKALEKKKCKDWLDDELVAQKDFEELKKHYKIEF